MTKNNEKELEHTDSTSVLQIKLFTLAYKRVIFSNLYLLGAIISMEMDWHWH